MLTAKFPLARINGNAVLYKSTQIKTNGGSSETEVKELTVRPASPSLLRVVTTVTPVVNWPITCLKKIFFNCHLSGSPLKRNAQNVIIHCAMNYVCTVVSTSVRFLSTVRKASIGILQACSVQFFIVDACVKC